MKIIIIKAPKRRDSYYRAKFYESIALHQRETEKETARERERERGGGVRTAIVPNRVVTL